MKTAWKKKASVRYRDFLNNIRQKNEKPNFLTEQQWERYRAMWGTSAFQRISQQNSNNRLSPAGTSLHTGGSRSHTEHAQAMVCLNSTFYLHYICFVYPYFINIFY